MSLLWDFWPISLFWRVARLRTKIVEFGEKNAKNLVKTSNQNYSNLNSPHVHDDIGSLRGTPSYKNYPPLPACPASCAVFCGLLVLSGVICRVSPWLGSVSL